MKFDETIQQYCATTAFVFVINTSIVAAIDNIGNRPIQTGMSAPLSFADPSIGPTMPDTSHESLAAEAIAYLRNSAGAVGGFNGVQSEIRRQGDFLVTWAKERGIFLTDFDSAGLEKYDRTTTEHSVYFGKPGSRVIKCTKPGKYGWGHGSNGRYGNHCPATPLFYLERLELMNREFPTDLRLEGIALGRPEYGDREVLLPYIITSQRYIEIVDGQHPHPSEGEIEALMKRLGFSLLPESRYNWIRESDGIIVTDTKILNFIISHEGIIPIDVVIGRKFQPPESA